MQSQGDPGVLLTQLSFGSKSHDNAVITAVSLSVVMFFGYPCSQQPDPALGIMLVANSSGALCGYSFVDSHIYTTQSPCVVSFVVFSDIAGSFAAVSTGASRASS